MNKQDVIDKMHQQIAELIRKEINPSEIFFEINGDEIMIWDEKYNWGFEEGWVNFKVYPTYEKTTDGAGEPFDLLRSIAFTNTDLYYTDEGGWFDVYTHFDPREVRHILID